MSDNNNSSGGEVQTEKAWGERNTKARKIQKTCYSDDEANGGDTSSCKEGGEDCKALNLSGKTRASRGAATDPQSLYARVSFNFSKRINVYKTFKEKATYQKIIITKFQFIIKTMVYFQFLQKVSKKEKNYGFNIYI